MKILETYARIFVRSRVGAAKPLVLLLIIALLVSPAHSAPRQFYAVTPDGVRIAIQEYGNPKGREVVFVHGLLGSHLNWEKQVKSQSLQKFRLITYDLRGHGLSSKPVAAAYYQDGARWGRELKTVIDATHLKRPVLVGWSMGDVVLTNYLALYSDINLAGVVYVDGVIELKPGLAGIPADTAADLSAGDLLAYLRGTRKFVRNCFFVPPAASSLVTLDGAAAMASPEMLRAVSQRLTVPAEATLPQIKVPVLIVYGQQDILVMPKTIMLAHRLIPSAKILRYPQTGHSSFYEQPERFNRDLSRFVSSGFRVVGFSPIAKAKKTAKSVW